jgi:chloramphenicol-sensitive protein RarD
MVQRSEKSLGLIFGLSAYLLWGLFPLYWPLLKPASAYEIVAHRAIWTLIFCLVVLAFHKKLRQTISQLRKPKIFFGLLATSALISVNWIVYIWATNSGHVVEASLGYYINPLVIIAFGVLLLKEKMRIGQWVAVGINEGISAPEFLQKAHPGWWPTVDLTGEQLANIGLQLPVMKPETGLIFEISAL